MSEPDGDEVNDSAYAGASPAGGAPSGIRENVRVLTGHLGVTLVASLTDGQDPGIASRWTWEGECAPDQTAETSHRRHWPLSRHPWLWSTQWSRRATWCSSTRPRRCR